MINNKNTVQTNWEKNKNFSNGLSKVEGILTSPIKTRQDTNEPNNQWATYHQAFFALEGIDQDIPVIFRVRCLGGNQVKPKISPKSKVELTGQWAESPSSTRPSFTCSYYRILTEPAPQPSKTSLNKSAPCSPPASKNNKNESKE